MYQAKHSMPGDAHSMSRRKKTAMFLLAFVLIAALTIGGTAAYLTSKPNQVSNTFTPSKVTCEVEEEFNGTEKTNVNVKNTGDTKAYIRVKLVSYRANENGAHIGGETALPEFTLGADWIKHDDYYYYTLPVEAGGTPASNLTDKMTLNGFYNDADGGKQVVEVMAEAIQSTPARAVGEAWGVSIAQGSVTAYRAGN